MVDASLHPTAAPTWLIGREHSSAVLRSAIERTAHSHGGLVLITGEAGVGKSSLATAAVDVARRTGALVLSGSCWDSDGVPDLWPWVQVARALQRTVAEPERERIDAGAWEGIAVLLGEHADAPHSGFALFDAVATVLATLACRRPVVLVMEDLHWADAASLDLLEFVAQHTWFEQVLLVGTYRDDEVDTAGHPLQGRLASLATRAQTLALGGLGPQETRALIERTTGRPPDEDAVETIHRWTGGNPFFVEQAARLNHGGGAATALAPGIREPVQRRLALLPAAVRHALSVAALLGREFHSHVLAEAMGEPDAQVAHLLDQAAVAKLVTLLSEGRCAFAHDLVREALAAEQSEDARRGTHLAVVHAADRSSRVAELFSPPELARHAHLAGDGLAAERAVELLVRAGEDAARRLAGQESLRHYRRAAERVEALPPRTQVTVLLDYCGVMRRLGDDTGLWREYARALDLALRSGESELYARVVLGFPYAFEEANFESWRMLVARAHQALLPDRPPQTDSPLAQAREMVEHLVRRAREKDDHEELAFALSSLHSSMCGPGSAQERLTLTRELEHVARHVGDGDLAHIAAALQWVALLELGDPRYLEQFRTFYARVKAEGAPFPLLIGHIDHAMVAGLLGDFDGAEASFTEAQASVDGFSGGPSGGLGLYRHQQWGLLLLQGRYEELDDLHRRAAQGYDALAGVQRALTAINRGDTATARAFLAEQGQGPQPAAEVTAPLWWRLRAQVAAATRDPQLGERARSELLPYSGEWLVSLYGYEVGGPADLWLGMAEAASERWDDALERLRAAHASARAMGSRPWAVEACLALAAALLDRGHGDDRESALALLDEAEGEAAGMRHVPGRVARMRDRAASEGRPTAADRDHEFRFVEGMWSLRFDGVTVHMPDAKGLRDLHLLLSSPGVDVPAVRLVNPAGGAEVEAAARMGGDDVLDERAKAEFRRRLAALDELIEGAEAVGDDERAAAHDRERAALLDELRAAAGLTGRTRRLGDAAERARKTVTARIRDTLGRLDRRHPELAAHLREAVSTGARCSYRPATETRWRL
jgi:hypothetical protein